MEGVTAAEMQNLITLYQDTLAAQDKVKEAEAALAGNALSDAAYQKTQRISEALYDWRNAAEGAEKDRAWAQYLALIDSDSDIQALLDAWADVSYGDGAEKDAYDAAVSVLTQSQAKAEAEAKAKAEAEAAQKAAYNNLLTAPVSARTVAYSSSLKATDAIKQNARSMGQFKLTFYCPCATCNGAVGVPTASGTSLVEGRTIAVDSSVIPLGSRVYIEGYGLFIAEDTGSAIKNNKIDVLVSSHSRAYQLGVQYANVYVLR